MGQLDVVRLDKAVLPVGQDGEGAGRVRTLDDRSSEAASDVYKRQRQP